MHNKTENSSKFGSQTLQHQSYSPIQAQVVFHLFTPLKRHNGSKHFADDEESYCKALSSLRHWPMMLAMEHDKTTDEVNKSVEILMRNKGYFYVNSTKLFFNFILGVS